MGRRSCGWEGGRGPVDVLGRSCLVWRHDKDTEHHFAAMLLAQWPNSQSHSPIRLLSPLSLFLFCLLSSLPLSCSPPFFRGTASETSCQGGNSSKGGGREGRQGRCAVQDVPSVVPRYLEVVPSGPFFPDCNTTGTTGRAALASMEPWRPGFESWISWGWDGGGRVLIRRRRRGKHRLERGESSICPSAPPVQIQPIGSLGICCLSPHASVLLLGNGRRTSFGSARALKRGGEMVGPIKSGRIPRQECTCTRMTNETARSCKSTK